MPDLRLLYVCTGNTCRSPMAEGIARHLALSGQFEGLREVLVQSAGTWAMPGNPATPEAQQAMRDRGIDISDHRGQPLNDDLIRWATHIYGMTRGHVDSVLELVPEAADRVRLLSEHDIPDPVGQSQEVYDHAADAIEKGVVARLKETSSCG